MQQKPTRKAKPCGGCGPNRKHDARGSSFKLDRVLVGTKLFRGQNRASDFRRFHQGRVLRKTGLLLFPNAETAADGVAVSFLYSALA